MEIMLFFFLIARLPLGSFKKSQKLLGDCVFNKWNDLTSEFRCISVSY